MEGSETLTPEQETSVRVFQRQRTGYFIEKPGREALDVKPVSYSMDYSGLFKFVNASCQDGSGRLIMVYRLCGRVSEPLEISGLDSTVKEGVDVMEFPIPSELFWQAASFMRRIYRVHGSESHVQFFFDGTKREYSIHVPVQRVSPCNVRYENNRALETDITRRKILEMHSHGQGSAFFSATDDHDECSYRFYGVLGRITDAMPQMKFRSFVGEREIAIEPEDIFEKSVTLAREVTFPEEWLSQCRKESFKSDNAILTRHSSADQSEREISGTSESGRNRVTSGEEEAIRHCARMMSHEELRVFLDELMAMHKTEDMVTIIEPMLENLDEQYAQNLIRTVLRRRPSINKLLTRELEKSRKRINRTTSQ